MNDINEFLDEESEKYMAMWNLEEYIFDTYGMAKQRLKLCEECAELIQAILKGDEKHIAEEIADVSIMIEQITYGMKNEKLVKSFMRMKLVRQIARMKASKELDGINIPLAVENALNTLGFNISDEDRDGCENDKNKCDPTNWG